LPVRAVVAGLPEIQIHRLRDRIAYAAKALDVLLLGMKFCPVIAAEIQNAPDKMHHSDTKI